MSEDLVALAVTLVILAVLFLWVPTLSICNDQCQRLLLRRKTRGSERTRADQAVDRAA